MPGHERHALLTPGAHCHVFPDGPAVCARAQFGSACPGRCEFGPESVPAADAAVPYAFAAWAGPSAEELDGTLRAAGVAEEARAGAAAWLVAWTKGGPPIDAHAAALQWSAAAVYQKFRDDAPPPQLQPLYFLGRELFRLSAASNFVKTQIDQMHQILQFDGSLWIASPMRVFISWLAYALAAALAWWWWAKWSGFWSWAAFVVGMALLAGMAKPAQILTAHWLRSAAEK